MEHACLWKSTGSAPQCSCHGNMVEYSFFFFFLNLIASLLRGVTEKQRGTPSKERRTRGQKRPRKTEGSRIN